MAFPPVYLVERFFRVEDLIWLDTDFCKPGCDGWHTKFKLNNGVIPVDLVDRKGKTIAEVRFHNQDRWFAKLEKTLKYWYSKSPYLPAVLDMVRPDGAPSFGEYNQEFMRRVFEYLGCGPRVQSIADLGVEKQTTASDWLARAGTAVGASIYVCAEDAQKKYLDPQPFIDRGILLHPQSWIMKPYREGATASHSILDLLLSCGKDQILEVLQ